MNLDEARAIIAARARRTTRAQAMLSGCFPEQRAAISDVARLKAFFCPRRSGKSWAIGIYLFLVALAFPGSSCLYLGLTKATATGIMNKDIFRVINDRFAIGAKWKESHSRWELPNGSYIYLRGADANSYEISKVVGQKYRLAVLDEASKYRYVVRDMVYGALLPAMGDDLGTVVLSGTPSNITTGLFYDVTTGAESGWSVHHWTWKANVYRIANIQRTHDDLLAANPALAGTPLYRQEWLGEWVVDTSALVYKFREDLNTASKLPRPPEQYMYILGVDLGFTDPSALVLGAYHERDPDLYLVHARKAAGLIISDVAALIKQLMDVFPIAAMVADASQLQGVEEMRQRHGLPLEAASKPGKRGVIEVMNSDLQTGRVKVLPNAMDIVEEWSTLIWDEKKLAGIPKKWEEDSRFENHLSDAGLYMWRKARNYDAVPAVAPRPLPGTQEWEELRHERDREHQRYMAAQGGLAIDELPAWLRGAE
jgi:hypothetical protein